MVGHLCNQSDIGRTDKQYILDERYEILNFESDLLQIAAKAVCFLNILKNTQLRKG